MKARIFILSILLALALAVGSRGTSAMARIEPDNRVDLTHVIPLRLAVTDQVQVAASARDSAVMFIENVGQFDPAVHFQVRSGDYTLWLADDALWITLRGADLNLNHNLNLRLSFSGANPSPRLEPFDRLETVVNYHRGNDPARWYTNVPVWGGVRYTDLYPGVDLEIIGEAGRWTWQLVFRDPQSAIRNPDARLQVAGANGVTVTDSVLDLHIAATDLTLPLPALESATLDTRPLVTSQQPGIFEVASPFATPASRLAVALDAPQALLYGTFLGGSNADQIEAVAVDQNGIVYLTGSTFSPDFPTAPGPSALNGDMDVFVAKLDPVGGGNSDLLYSTFIGGDSQNASYDDGETGYDIAVDENGTVYVTGSTRAGDFPTTPDALDTTFNGEDPCSGYSPPVACTDAFVLQLDNSGALAYATYLGGSAIDVGGGSRVGGLDVGEGIAVKDGIIYVTGWTISEDFPITAGAYDNHIDWNRDVFVVKLDPAQPGAAGLLYSTYIGGQGEAWGKDIAVDGDGIVYVIGDVWGSTQAAGTEFPTTAGAIDRYLGMTSDGRVVGEDAFVLKLNPAGNGPNDLLYSTYLGEERWEKGEGIAVDEAGMVYVTGWTWSPDFPTTPGAFDRVCGTDGDCEYPTPPTSVGDAFVSKLDLAGNGTADIIYSTFLGGGRKEEPSDIAVDNNGHIYVTGFTYSSGGYGEAFPTTPGAFDTTFNSSYHDAFVTRLNPGGAGADDLVYSTLLGGGQRQWGKGIAPGTAETVYVAGYTQSSDFPTTTLAYDTTFGGGTCDDHPCDDGFLVKLNIAPRYTIRGQVLDGNGNAISGVQITADETYSATTDAGGWYTVTNILSGTYTLTPPAGYFWSPESRTITVPPDATGQDFTGRNIRKQVTPAVYQGTLYLGDRLTYTVGVVYTQTRTLGFYDRVPTHTTFINGSLSGPAGVVYDSIPDAISGTMSLVAGEPATVTFAVRMGLTGTVGFAPVIVNRACVYPSGGDPADCEWSNKVRTLTYAWQIYLPLVMR